MSIVPASDSRISERILQIRQTLPASVRLIAVTKQVSIAAMRAAYAAGVRDFGESRIQEAETKQAELEDLTDLTWHLIGHLQSNKVQKALTLFQWIHSIDSLKLAQRLDQLAAPLRHKPQLCLQVKILPDPNKYGWAVDDLLSDLAALDACENLAIRGLMAIPPQNSTEAQIRSVFQKAQALATTIRQQPWRQLQMQELSIGMSNDYLVAVQTGATMVRLGTVLFGDRAAQGLDRPLAANPGDLEK